MVYGETKKLWRLNFNRISARLCPFLLIKKSDCCPVLKILPFSTIPASLSDIEKQHDLLPALPDALFLHAAQYATFRAFSHLMDKAKFSSKAGSLA